MPDIRASFVEHFGEDEASRIEGAANLHANGINSRNEGLDPFRWAICITIGYECWTRPRFREWHGFTASIADLKRWVKEHGHLANHDGDSDFLAGAAGCYEEYLINESNKKDKEYEKCQNTGRGCRIFRLYQEMRNLIRYLAISGTLGGFQFQQCI